MVSKIVITIVVAVVGSIMYWHSLPDPLAHPLPDSNFGANPTIPEPEPERWFPVVRFPFVSPAPNFLPSAPQGFSVSKFGTLLEAPRWLYALPNNDLLVAEARTTLPGKKSWEHFLLQFFTRGTNNFGQSPNRLVLFRDSDNDGVAEVRSVFLSDVDRPLGMTLVDGRHFFVGSTSALLYCPYEEGALSIERSSCVEVMRFPEGGYNNHWTRNVVYDQVSIKDIDGPVDKEIAPFLLPRSAELRKSLSSLSGSLLITIGSASNIGEYGEPEENMRACVLRYDLRSGVVRWAASGIRNPVGLSLPVWGGEWWAAVNERDLLGDDVAPDYLTRVASTTTLLDLPWHYGWPWRYWNTTDVRAEQHDAQWASKRERVSSGKWRHANPDYALGSHTASLGLAFSDDSLTLWPKEWRHGAFIGQHGSWNRREFSGYKVLFVPFDTNGAPSSVKPAVDFLSGFVANSREKRANGRPVGILFHRQCLLVADDSGAVIWRVCPKQQQQQQQ